MTPERIGSHYLLHERIGQGGTGTVWRGEDTTSGEPRAIKVLKPEYARDPAAVARFVRERNALIALRHPSVVALHDMIAEGDTLALVMDLITGGDLDKFRRARGSTLDPQLAADLIAQACDALTAAHALGIVHRDLKPANILMDAGRVRLTDFGIARIGGEAAVTTTGMVLGTVSYMAPEALAGGAPAPACDVYAAGVTLYELLAGQPPFTGQAPVVITGHLHHSPPRPDGVPEPLWQVIAACLAKDPAARPTAAQLAAAMRRPDSAPGWAVAPAQSAGRAQPAGAQGPAQPVAAQWDAQPAASANTGAASVPGPVTGAAPHTITGIGWVTPAGPATPPAAHGMSSTWPAPPVAPATRAKRASRGGAENRRRTWVLAAAAIVLVAASAGTAMALTSGNTTAPAAVGAPTSPTVTGQAALAATGTTPTATPSGAHRQAKGSNAGTPTSSSSTQRSAAPPTPSSSTQRSAAPSNNTTQSPAATPTPGVTTVTATPPAPQTSPSSAPNTTPNPYTAAEVCGSSYSVIDSHALAGGTVYLLWSNSTNKNCVTTIRSQVSGKVAMSATLAVQGGSSAADAAQYTYYAGPVALAAPKTCVMWGGSIGSSSWTSAWSHCS